jgi:hypothetical protein
MSVTGTLAFITTLLEKLPYDGGEKVLKLKPRFA